MGLTFEEPDPRLGCALHTVQSSLQSTAQVHYLDKPSTNKPTRSVDPSPPSPTPHPDLQLNALVVAIDGLHFEVNAHSADKSRGEGVVGIPEEERSLAHTAVADDQDLEHIVKVLV